MRHLVYYPMSINQLSGLLLDSCSLSPKESFNHKSMLQSPPPSVHVSIKKKKVCYKESHFKALFPKTVKMEPSLFKRLVTVLYNENNLSTCVLQ